MSLERPSLSRVRGAKAPVERTFVLCSVGPSLFAIGVEHVREIVTPSRLTPLPSDRFAVLGAFDHRGLVVPVVDFSTCLGRGELSAGRAKWIVLVFEGQTLALAVGQVADVLRANEQDLRLAPGADSSAYTTGQVVTHQGQMAFVVAMDRIAELAL